VSPQRTGGLPGFPVRCTPARSTAPSASAFRSQVRTVPTAGGGPSGQFLMLNLGLA